MKHIIILGDGMADWPAESLGNKTLLQYSSTPYMDKLAAMGRTGRLVTVAPGFHPGSEVANMSVMGYNLPWAVGSSKHRGGVATGRYGYAL
jgi:2,3-bisphosphoglycerate-independent phosphoglycerate mutase